MSATSFEYKAHIDGLRAVAILLVVLYHVGLPGIHGGFVGVDVFFVISGYLITSLLLVECQQRGRIDLAGFYARRVRRLFPALMIVVSATLALAAFFLLPIFSEQSALAKSAIATSLYLSNVYFWRYTGGYFDGPRDFEPLLHTWSLAVEEQFYLVWPFLIIGLLAVRRSSGNALRRDLLVLLAVLSALSFAFSVWATRTHPAVAFYLMPSRAWQFGIGGILATAIDERALTKRVANLISALGLVAIVGSGQLLTERGFPGVYALLPTLGAAAVIAGNTCNSGTLVAALLSSRPFRFIGLVSYSWYLWHWPLLAIVRASALKTYDLPRDLLLGLVSLLLAAATYRLVENPIRRGRPGPFKTTTATLWTGACISIFLSVSAAVLAVNAQRAATSNPRYVEAERARLDAPVLRGACLHPLSGEFRGLPSESTCTYGNPANIRAVLWGDSHADHLSGLLQAFAEQHGDTGVLQRTFSSCRTYGEDSDITTVAMAQACEDFNVAVEKEIRDLHERGLTGVIISTLWSSVFRDPAEAVPPGIKTSPEYYADAAAAIDAVVSRLEAAGVRILIVGPFHLMPYEIPECLARHSDADCSATRAAIDRQRHVSLDVLRHIKSRHGDSVRLWDPIDALCDASTCPATRDGAVLYTDALHLTMTGGRALLPAANDQLTWVTGS